MTDVVATDVTSRLSGSIIYSEATTPQILLTSNQFSCFSAFTSIIPGPPNIGGAFFIKGALGVTSASNSIRNCYHADIGGAFHIEESKLTDSSSYLGNNAAVKGGAISCKKCTLLSLMKTEFE